MPNGVLTASIFSEKDAYAYFEKNEKGEFVRKSDFYHTEKELKEDDERLTDEYIEENGKILPLKYEEVESILFGGASINLSYSDFGILKETGTLKSKEENLYSEPYNDKIHQLFFGGYDNKLIANNYNKSDMDEMVKNNGSMNFLGRALGGAFVRNEVIDLDGIVELSIDENAKQTATFKFENLLNFKYEDGKYTTYEDNNNKFNDFFRENAENYIMTSYYGDAGKASEVVGRFHYSDKESGNNLEISFGAKNNK